MKNILTDNSHSSQKTPAQLQSGFTRRGVLQALGAVGVTAGGASGFIRFLSSIPDDRKFQESELEIVELSSTTQPGSMNPASRFDPSYRLNPARKLQLGNKEKYTVSLRLPDGTIDSREVSEDIFKKLQEGDKVLCRYLVRYDGMQLVTEVLPDTTKS